MDRIKALFKEKGLKLTPQRLLVYRLLDGNRRHPSADDVYRAVKKKSPCVSFDTVYRTLLTFAELGLLNIVEGYGDAKRFDPDTGQHHHARCIKCGSITDFQDKSLDAIAVPPDIAGKFRVVSKKMVLDGYCQTCRPGEHVRKKGGSHGKHS